MLEIASDAKELLAFAQWMYGFITSKSKCL